MVCFNKQFNNKNDYFYIYIYIYLAQAVSITPAGCCSKLWKTTVASSLLSVCSVWCFSPAFAWQQILAPAVNSCQSLALSKGWSVAMEVELDPLDHLTDFAPLFWHYVVCADPHSDGWVWAKGLEPTTWGSGKWTATGVGGVGAQAFSKMVSGCGGDGFAIVGLAKGL